MPSRIGWTSESSLSPASVSATLRVVRLNIRIPSRSSRERIVWLMVGRAMPTCAAALVKLRCSATATKAVSSLSWMRAIIRACQANYSEYSRLSKDRLAFKLVGQRPGSSSSASLSKKERTVQQNPKIGASLLYSGQPDAPSGPQRRLPGRGLVEPLPPAARARHLLEEARTASLEHLR